MNPKQDVTERTPEPETSVSAHYAELTEHMVNFGGNLLACHFGLWGPDTATDREALLRANHTLVQGCDLGPGQRILDAGCGVGGTAIMLAETYGARVTGLTVCEPHIAVATEQAEQRGVSHLVEFRHGDFMNLPFPDETFDLVLNHESFCYASDKLAYLQGVYRVLKPGARWQTLEGFTSGAPISDEQEAMHASAQYGWRMPPLEPWRDMRALLKTAGFKKIWEQDLSSEVMPATKKLRERWKLFTFLVPPSSLPSQASLEFMEATVNYDQGLREGIFTYHFISATRPA